MCCFTTHLSFNLPVSERIFTIGAFGEVTDKRIVFCFVLFSDSRVVAKFEEQTQQQQQQQPQY